MEYADSVDIDNYEDLKKAEFYLSERLEKMLHKIFKNLKENSKKYFNL